MELATSYSSLRPTLQCAIYTNKTIKTKEVEKDIKLTNKLIQSTELMFPHSHKHKINNGYLKVVSCGQKYVHLVLVNSLGGLSLPRNSVISLTDRSDMAIAVYLGL